jgi:predicted O-linked N-acetylglucosamine transferase (SPINDLY family)
VSATPDAYTTGVASYTAGRLGEAESAFRGVPEGDARHAGALYFLGAIAHQRGRCAVAVQYLRQAVAAGPSAAAAHSALGAAYQGMGLFPEAEACQRRALALAPADPQALNNLGITLVSLGRREEAVAAFRAALRARPHDAEVLNNLAAALRAKGDLLAAVAHYRRALELAPALAHAHHNLGNALRALGQLDEAAACHEKALALNPEFTAARLGLGVALAEQGKLAEGLDRFLGVLRARPRDHAAHSSYLFGLNHHPDVDAATLLAEHRRWAGRQVRLWGSGVHDNDPDPERRLRVGYVSPDFRSHAAAYFIEALLKHHDRGRVEVFCYSDASTPDATTARLRALADQWRDTAGLPDGQVADLIAEDGIDVLVDLAGHTEGNRLLLFARRPAPVLVSYLGYPCTTGLPARVPCAADGLEFPLQPAEAGTPTGSVHYRLGDAVTDPPGEPGYYTEELVRLEPVFCCYAPPRHAPPVSPLPAERNGYVTFGALHKLEKLNDRVLDVWCELLRSVPSARLLLARHVLRGRTVAEWRDRSRQRGLDDNRVELRSVEAVDLRHLRQYADIDVALDAFPWNGHTTACEALWMGVPVVTLRGDRHAGRMVASLLTCLGLQELVAETPADYVLHRRRARRRRTAAGGDAGRAARPDGGLAAVRRAGLHCYIGGGVSADVACLRGTRSRRCAGCPGCLKAPARCVSEAAWLPFHQQGGYDVQLPFPARVVRQPVCRPVRLAPPRRGGPDAGARPAAAAAA